MRKRREEGKKRGTARMKEQGYLRVELWLSPHEADMIRQAIRFTCVGRIRRKRPLATWIREAVVQQSEKIVLSKLGVN